MDDDHPVSRKIRTVFFFVLNMLFRPCRRKHHSFRTGSLRAAGTRIILPLSLPGRRGGEPLLPLLPLPEELCVEPHVEEPLGRHDAVAIL